MRPALVRCFRVAHVVALSAAVSISVGCAVSHSENPPAAGSSRQPSGPTANSPTFAYLEGILATTTPASITLENLRKVEVSPDTQICRRTCEARPSDLQAGDRISTSASVDGQGRLVASWINANGVSGWGLVTGIGPDALVIRLNRGYPGEERVLFVGEQTRLPEPKRSSLTSFERGDLVYFTGTTGIADVHAREVWALLISASGTP
jgi:hypothetical protein